MACTDNSVASSVATIFALKYMCGSHIIIIGDDILWTATY